MSSEDAREYYNRLWGDAVYANRLKLMRCEAILGALARVAPREPRILDLGCGTGWLSSVLGQFGPTTGVDLSDRAIKAAAAKYPYVTFVQADLFSWRPPRDAFDVVVSQEVIEHVDRQAEYLEIARAALTDTGFLILTTPNAATFRAMSDEQLEGWGRQPIENHLTREELIALLEVRFRVLEVTTIVPGYGSRGVRRIINSERLSGFLRRGLGGTLDRLKLQLGYGLHLVAVAQAR